MEFLSVRLQYERGAGSLKRLIPSCPANRHLLIANRFGFEKLFGRVGGRAISDYEDDERITGSVRVRRPLHELEKVVDEHRLDLRFVHRALCSYTYAEQQRGEEVYTLSNGAEI